MTVRRSDGRTAVVIVAVTLLTAVWPTGRLAAQDSQFGIRGLGTPGKWESVRARTTGGAFAPFDAFSPLTDAVLADVRRMSASMTSGTSWRSVDASGTQSSLKSTRFPALVIAGPVTRRIVVGGGFTTYLDRSFGVVIHDTITLRGVQQPITDEITSDGAIPDLRADVGGHTVAENDLPLMYGAGVQWRAGAQATVAGNVTWRNWGAVQSIANSHDTFNWSLGAEIGAPASPFRFGLRGGQLPFGVGKTPTEVGFSGGLGRQFSGGRGRLDIGLERLQRSGTGLNERVWTVLLGLTVRP